MTGTSLLYSREVLFWANGVIKGLQYAVELNLFGLTEGQILDVLLR